MQDTDHRSLCCSSVQLVTPRVLTLIIALEVMRKRVARSLTALIFSPPSRGTFRPSSSLRERCRAAPCLAIRSLQVLRSSSLLTRIFKVPWISLRSDWDVGSSSPESSERSKLLGINYVFINPEKLCFRNLIQHC